MAEQRYDREARRAERARLARLGRLPFLYDFSLRGTPQAVLVVLVQSVLTIVLALAVTRLVSGQLFPSYAIVVVLAVSLGLQALSRYLNARAGRG